MSLTTVTDVSHKATVVIILGSKANNKKQQFASINQIDWTNSIRVTQFNSAYRISMEGSLL